MRMWSLIALHRSHPPYQHPLLGGMGPATVSARVDASVDAPASLYEVVVAFDAARDTLRIVVV